MFKLVKIEDIINSIMRNQNEYEKNKASDNQFKPARLLYLIVLLMAFGLSFLCLLISKESPWFAIGTGISCGGVASTIVAWLIDEANNSAARKKARNNQNYIINKLFASFDTGLQILITYIERRIKYETPQRWYEWIECSMELCEKNIDFRTEFCLAMKSFFQEIEDVLHEIISQETILLEYRIVNEEDIKVLTGVHNCCSIVINELHADRIDEKAIDYISTYCDLIKVLMDHSIHFKLINERKIEPELYRIELKHDNG